MMRKKNTYFSLFNFRSRSGLTLIEMVVVVGVIAMALPVFFSLVFSLLRQQVKILALNQVKKEGDAVLTSIESGIRSNTIQIRSKFDDSTTQVCSTPGSNFSSSDGTNFYLMSPGGVYGRLYLEGTKLAYNINSTTPHFLTSDKVTISGFQIRCDKNTDATVPIISISYTVSYNTTSTRPEDVASLQYRVRIKLRNR